MTMNTFICDLSLNNCELAMNMGIAGIKKQTSYDNWVCQKNPFWRNSASAMSLALGRPLETRLYAVINHHPPHFYKVIKCHFESILHFQARPCQDPCIYGSYPPGIFSPESGKSQLQTPNCGNEKPRNQRTTSYRPTLGFTEDDL